MVSVSGLRCWGREEAEAEVAASIQVEGREERIQAREDARRERDYPAADAVRDELAAKGIVLEDTPEGTRWKVVRPG